MLGTTLARSLRTLVLLALLALAPSHTHAQGHQKACGSDIHPIKINQTTLHYFECGQVPLTPPTTTTVSAATAAPVPSRTGQQNPAGREIPATTVAPTASISESAAREVIEAYYAAYRAWDFKALRAIFPDAPDLDKKRIEALRKDYERCDYILWGLQVLRGSRAAVRIDVTQICRPRNRAPARKVGTRCTFWLGTSADGRWIITRGPRERDAAAFGPEGRRPGG
jgi:hypothetical protein